MYCKCSKGNNYKVIGECNPRKFDQTTVSPWNQITVPEILQLPECYPDIEDLERVYVDVVIESIRIVETPKATNPNIQGTKITGFKLMVDGSICQTVVYTADNCEQALHSINFRYPFCTYIVLGEDVDIEEDKFCIEYCIENVYAKALNKRTIFKNVTLFLLAVKDTPSCPATNQISGVITNNRAVPVTVIVALVDSSGNTIDYQQYTIVSHGTQKYSFNALCSGTYTVELLTGFGTPPIDEEVITNLPANNVDFTIS